MAAPKSVRDYTAACEAYKRGMGFEAVKRGFNVGTDTLNREMDARGIVRRPRGRTVMSGEQAYVAGRKVKPCIRCREKPSGVDLGGLCETCNRVPICTCPPGRQHTGTVRLGERYCGSCSFVIFPFRPAKRVQQSA